MIIFSIIPDIMLIRQNRPAT